MFLHQINFTRFIAAITVVIFHYGATAKPFNIPIIHKLFNTGNSFVIYFFILSGFILAIAYSEKIEKTSFKKFIAFRLGRIYPAFLFSIVLSIFTNTIEHNPINWNWATKILSLTHGWINPWLDTSGKLYNPPAWTLSLEFFFYLSFPISLIFLKKRGNSVLYYSIFGLIILNYFIQYNFDKNALISVMKTYIPHPLFYIQTFFIGICLGLLFTRKQTLFFEKIKKSPNTINNLIMLFLLVLSWILIIFFDVTMANDTSLIICFVGFIWCLSKNNGNISVLFSKKPLVFLGEISFGIYILQYPVKQLFDYFFYNKYGYHFTIYFYVYLITLILIAAFSYIFIEKPVLSLVKSKLI